MGIAKVHSNQCRYVYMESAVDRMIFCDELKHKKSWFLVPKSEPMLTDFHCKYAGNFNSEKLDNNFSNKHRIVGGFLLQKHLYS